MCEETEDQESPKDFVEVYKLLESIRSRAGTEQLHFLNISAAGDQLFIRTALVLNGGSIIVLNAFIATEFTKEFFNNGTILPLAFVLVPSSLFFLGIISAVCSFHFHYLNYLYFMNMIHYQWEEEIRPIKEKYTKINYRSHLLREMSISYKLPRILEFLKIHRIFKFPELHKITEENKNNPHIASWHLIKSTAEEQLKSAYYSYAFFAAGYIVVAIIFSISVLISDVPSDVPDEDSVLDWISIFGL